jgi:endonuclease/exonuclease/phosphatase family metal-dependent hydrolase
MDIVNGVIGLGILYGVGHYMTRNNKPSRKQPSNTKSIKNKTANRGNFNTKTRNTSTNQPLNKTNTQTNQPLNKTNRQTNQPLNKTNRQTNQPPKTQNTNQPATQNTNQPATQNTNQPNATPVNVKKDTSDVINLLFWNILYTNFKDKKGDEIIEYINKTKPDIMVLNEASHLVPKDNIGKKDYYNKITLDKYTDSVYHAKKDKDGTLIYFNPSKFKLLKMSKGISIGMKQYKPFVNRPYIDSGFNRACLGVTLDYKGEHIHVIGVHLGHHVPLETIQQGIKKIMVELKIKPEDRVILGGDFNELYQKKNYETAFDGLTLYNTVNTLVDKTNAPSDLIYSNRPLRVVQGKGSPSDHFALIAKIEK